MRKMLQQKEQDFELKKKQNQERIIRKEIFPKIELITNQEQLDKFENLDHPDIISFNIEKTIVQPLCVMSQAGVSPILIKFPDNYLISTDNIVYITDIVTSDKSHVTN